MRPLSLSTATLLSLLTFVANPVSGAATTAAIASANATLTGKRTTNMLGNIAGFGPLPSTAQTGGLNANDIQGDILIGMKKKKEVFYFFQINNPASFKKKLKIFIAPFITSTAQLLSTNTQPIVALNVAFSFTGLTALNVTDDLGDPLFTQGQFSQAAVLGDPGTGNWVSAFAGNGIHGAFLMASDDLLLVDAQEIVIEGVFGSDITKLYSLQGSIRPGAEAGHEPFGFLDGISQPAVTGFGTPLPGQLVVNPGVILVGESGDPITRPTWAKDGSFLAFRQLEQLVPEFSQFLVANAPTVPGLTAAQSADLLGARMVGRWKSGAPVDLNPLFDNPAMGANPQQNNNFTYQHDGFDLSSDQTHCPFDAHTRKTHPRADLFAPNNSIIRAGIPYGPEVTAAESASHTTQTERGLAFVSYQAQIGQGFQFLQNRWANNPGFIFNKNISRPGFDPIIGANAGQARFMMGFDPNNANSNLTMMSDFIISHGGVYLFSPSISAIKTVITA